MAASWSGVVKVGLNVAYKNRTAIFQLPIQCRTCLQSVSFNHQVRKCSQFTDQAAKMDGNTYRLKDGEVPESEKNGRRRLPLYLEAQHERYIKSRAYKVKKYQWEGEASGIDPAIMWPTRNELEKMKAYDKEWSPTLQEMQTELEEERRIQRLKTLKREKIIAANMAKMPKMIGEFEGKLADQKRQEEEQKKKRARLLEEARAKLGYNVDHRSQYFKAMMEEMEQEEKKKNKELKKKARMARLGMVIKE